MSISGEIVRKRPSIPFSSIPHVVCFAFFFGRGSRHTQQVAVSQPHVERLFAAQSNLELRVARSLSLGRWLWRGVNFSAVYAAAVAAAPAAAAGNSAGIDGAGVTGDGGGFTSAGIPLLGGSRVDGAGGGGGGGGIWVPWEAEAANASPERLKVRPTRDRFRTCQSKYAEEWEALVVFTSPFSRVAASN